MLSKSLLLACLLYSSSKSVVKGQINTATPNPELTTTTAATATAIPTTNSTVIPTNNSTVIQPEMNCTVQDGELPELQSGLNNFVIDTLDDTFSFPFALQQCTSASLLPSTKRYMYECNFDNAGAPTVVKTEYNDVNCSGQGTVVEQFSESNGTAGAKGYFDCSGSDAYIQIEFSFNSTCENAVTIYGALGSCSNFINSSSNSLQMNMYCNEDEAVMQIFNLMNSFNVSSSTFAPLFNATSLNDTAFPSTSNQPESMMCTDETFCDKWTISNQCKMVTSFPLLANNQTLYGRMLGCNVDSMSSTELMSTTNLNISLTDILTTGLNISLTDILTTGLNISLTDISTTDLNISLTDILTTGLNISVTDIINATTGATGGETSTSTSTSTSETTSTSVSETTSSAIRQSFLLASSLLLSLLVFFSI